MTRECQVRICERLGVRLPGPTRQRDWLRTLYELNTAAWDEIALGSPEASAVVAKAAKAVSSALGD